MDSKLASLIERLEKSVERLEGLQGGHKAPAEEGAAGYDLSKIQNLINAWNEKAAATKDEGIIDMTNISVALFKWHCDIVNYSVKAKKPSNEIIGKLAGHLRAQAKLIDDKYIFPRKLENQGKAVKEGLGACLWMFAETALDHLSGVIDPAVYSGNKVKMLKIDAQTQWMDAFYALLNGIKAQVKETFGGSLIWKGKTDGDWTPFLNPGAPSSAQPTASKPATTTTTPTTNTTTPTPTTQPSGGLQAPSLKLSAPKLDLPPQAELLGAGGNNAGVSADDARAQLFAQLNQGENITSMLKKADRKPKGVIDDRPPLEPKKKATHEEKKETTKAAKEPVIFQKDNWFIENWNDQSCITMDKATMKEIVYIENCSNCGIMVKGKVKAIMLSNCKKISLMFDEVVSTVEAVRVATLTVQVKIFAPSITFDNCQYVKLYLATNLETEIISTKVTELNVSYIEKDDDYAKETPITEQFTTKWDPKLKRFVTKPLELFMP